MAASAIAEIGTTRRDAGRRGLNDFLSAGASEVALLLDECRFGLFSFENKRNENGFAGTMFVGR